TVSTTRQVSKPSSNTLGAPAFRSTASLKWPSRSVQRCSCRSAASYAKFFHEATKPRQHEELWSSCLRFFVTSAARTDPVPIYCQSSFMICRQTSLVMGLSNPDERPAHEGKCEDVMRKSIGRMGCVVLAMGWLIIGYASAARADENGIVATVPFAFIVNGSEL